MRSTPMKNADTNQLAADLGLRRRISGLNPELRGYNLFASVLDEANFVSEDMEKKAKEAEDISLLRPRMRKRMGEEMAAIFEEVGHAALEKAMSRSVAAIADEVVAFSDELAKKVRDSLGKKGITEAVNYIPAWADEVAKRALQYAESEVSPAIQEGMKSHFPIGQDQEQEGKQAMLQYKDAFYVEVDALSSEPFQRAMDRIEDLKSRGKDPIAGTMSRLQKTEDPGKIQGIFLAAKKLGKKWKAVADAAAKKYRNITGKVIR